MQFRVYGVYNPASTRPTSPFFFQILDSTNALINSMDIDRLEVTVQMTTPAELQEASVT